MTETSRRRLWLFRLLAAAGGPLVFFVLLELLLRAGGVGFDPRFWIPLAERPALMSNPAFGWRFFPRAQARQPLAQDVALPAAETDEARRRIVVLGGSAAMGIPDPAFSFGRILGVMLEQAELAEGASAGRVEVVNAAMTAVNSHVVREIAGELHRLEPDAVVVYMGNNEVVGPFGAGAARTDTGPPPLAAVRASVLLSRTRLAQLSSRLLGEHLGRSEGWRGMEAFAGHRLLPGDARLDRIYDHFESNLRQIIRRAREAGARVLVSTVAVDLYSTPPFASAGEREEAVEAALDKARRAIERSEGAQALAAARAASELEPQHAEAHYRLGLALDRLGRREEAKASLERARDLDALRFRADSEINRRIRAVTAEEGAVLVEAAEILAERAPRGVPGKEFFFEHVHFTFAGAYELARAFFLAWPSEETGPTAREPASLETCAASLAFGDWQRLGQLEDIVAMMTRPPFTGRAGHRQRLAELRREKRRLERRMDARLRDSTRRRLEQALAARPGDIESSLGLAELLRSAGRGREALRVLEPLLDRLPRSPGLWLDAGNAALTADDLATARQYYERAVRLDPYAPDGAFNLGVLAVREERYEEAAEHFRAVLEADRHHLEARLNLAAALDQLGRPEQALDEYSAAFEIAPDEPLTLHRLAVAFEERGETAEAAALWQRGLSLHPRDPATQTLWARRLAERGRQEEAIRRYAAALREDPDFEPALTGLVELHNRRASEQAAAGDLNGAVTSLYKALAASPGHAPSHFNLAMVLGRGGRREDAVRHLEQAYLGARREGLETLENEAESRLRALDRWPVERSAEN